MERLDEFNLVCLAGLLHDIGKFYARSKKVRSLIKEAEIPGRHPIISAFVIEREFKSLLESLKIDTSLLKTLVQHHHENPTFPSECLVESLKGKERILASIVSRADNYSSSERYEVEAAEKKSYGTAFMDSIFVNVSFQNGQIEKKDLSSFQIAPSVLNPEGIFPQAIDSYQWDNLTENFGRELANLKSKNFDSLLVSLLSLINKYCWCVPSDITREVKDVSLSDHLKTSSAIAACLYKYHANTETLNEESIRDESAEKFMLIGGDLSGIQNYIYDIAEIGVGGIAKRLRARSFSLSLLMEVTAHFLLHKLNLPLSCLIYSSGGRFYILSSNDPQTRSDFDRTRKFIEEWLIRNFNGEIAINLSFVSFSPTGFSASGVGDVDEKKNFKSVWERLSRKIENSKKRKFERVLVSEGRWSNNFLLNQDYFKKGICKSCAKNPAHFEREGNLLCLNCSIDLELGKKLLKASYLAFYNQREEGDINFFDDYSVKILTNIKSSNDLGLPYLVITLNDSEILPELPSTFKFVANYIPVFKDEKEQLEVCQECGLKKCDLKNAFFVSQPYSFACLASTSEGAKYLGVYKADVDQLGKIIREGIKPLTLSRLSTFSHFIDLFFSGFLPQYIKQNYPETYVVYAGGDDLLFCGPWNKIIDLAKEVAEKFQELSAYNPEIHLSSGIILCPPKFPFSSASKFAHTSLEEAKEAKSAHKSSDFRGNRLSVFSTIIEWNHFDEVLEFARLLADSLQKKEISSSFVYSLLGYYELYQRTKENDNLGYLYLPRLSYSIRRNLYDHNDKPINEHLVNSLRRLLDIKDEGGMRLMETLKFSVSYALLKNRGEKQ